MRMVYQTWYQSTERRQLFARKTITWFPKLNATTLIPIHHQRQQKIRRIQGQNAFRLYRKLQITPICISSITWSVTSTLNTVSVTKSVGVDILRMTIRPSRLTTYQSTPFSATGQARTVNIAQSINLYKTKKSKLKTEREGERKEEEKRDINT